MLGEAIQAVASSDQIRGLLTAEQASEAVTWVMDVFGAREGPDPTN